MKKNFEDTLLKVLLESEKTFNKTSRLINHKVLFQNNYNRFIYQTLLEYKLKYGALPSNDNLLEYINSEYSDHRIKTIITDHLVDNIFKLELKDSEIQFYIDSIVKRQKENIIQSLRDKMGKLDEEEFIQYADRLVALDNLKSKYEINHLWDDIEEEEREVIPTNLELIDEFGVGRGELGLLIAGTGIGKSVFLTFLANEFMLGGYKVLHIVFEGSKSSYLQSHKRKMNNPTSEELKNNPNVQNLKLVQLKANQTTTEDIESILKELEDSDFRPDVMVVDYLDCIVGKNLNKENWQNDTTIINELEHISQKYNMVIWTAAQANRSGINKPLELTNVSGGVSKIQKATIVLGLMRDERDQEQNTATLSILKNRFGPLRHSIGCKWNPTTMEINAPITELITL